MMRKSKLVLVAVAVIAMTAVLFYLTAATAGSESGDNQVTVSPVVKSDDGTYAQAVETMKLILVAIPVTTTTTVVTKTDRPTRPKIQPVEPAVTSGDVPAFLKCVARYESGSNYSSHTANGSGGMYGFLTVTFQRGGWAARYGVTYPYQATPAQQDEMAMELYASSGSRPWSTRDRCGG